MSFGTKTTRILIGFPVRPSQGVRGIFVFGDENPTRKKQSRRGKAVSGKGSEQPETKRRNGNTARTKNTTPVPEAEKAEAGNKTAERKHGTDKKRETGIRSGKAEAGNKTGYGTAQSGRRGKSRGVRSAEMPAGHHWSAGIRQNEIFRLPTPRKPGAEDLETSGMVSRPPCSSPGKTGRFFRDIATPCTTGGR